MRRIIVIAALLAVAACGPKSKQPSGETEEPDGTEEGGGGEDDGVDLAAIAPELDALETELGSVRDLPSEERDVEVCEAQRGLARMVGDLDGATPAGVDEATWDDAVDAMNASLGDLKQACPDDLDGIDAAFTALLDAVDGLVETTRETATGA